MVPFLCIGSYSGITSSIFDILESLHHEQTTFEILGCSLSISPFSPHIKMAGKDFNMRNPRKRNICQSTNWVLVCLIYPQLKLFPKKSKRKLDKEVKINNHDPVGYRNWKNGTITQTILDLVEYSKNYV